MPARSDLDPHGSVEDEEELISRIAGPGQYKPSGSIDDPGDAGDVSELLLGAPVEDWNGLESRLVVANCGSGQDRLQSMLAVVRDRAIHHAADQFHVALLPVRSPLPR